MSDLTYRAATRIVREGEAAVRDKSYRRFPVGEVGRFLRAKRMAGARPNTLVSYESVLARLTLRHADFESLEPFAVREHGPELILDFLERHWGDASEATRKRRYAVLTEFFKWAYRTDRISANPMEKLERPRRLVKKGARTARVPAPHVARLVSAQDSLRDQAAILLLGRLALRREDLRLLQLGDLDLGNDLIHLRHAKGGKEDVMPLPSPTCGERSTCTYRGVGDTRTSTCSIRRTSA